MKVIKFGGTSCADASQLRKVQTIVEQDPRREVVVVSAPGKRSDDDHKITDMLYLAHQLVSIDMGGGEVLDHISRRFLDIRNELGLSLDLEEDLSEIRQQIFSGASADFCASRGEYLSAKVVAELLGFQFVDAAELIRFDDGGSLDMAETQKQVRARLNGGRYVVPGFYGSTGSGRITTFSRGGSDITGAILAGALGAEVYENWTDVSGFLAADPHIVKSPVPIRVVTYEELHELSYMGAQVLHEDAVYPARRAGVPIQILNTNAPEAEGTRIVPSAELGDRIVTGIAGKTGFMVITIMKRHGGGDAGFLRRLTSVFEANSCAIEHMPSSMDTVSVIVREDQFRSRRKKILEEIDIFSEPDSIRVSDNVALLAVVGEGMAQRPGVAARMFQALGQAGISIRMISQGASELNIIIGVGQDDFERSVRVLYQEFFDEAKGEE